MIDENRATPNRIPVRFVDDAEGAGRDVSRGADDLTPEELGRASSYEDATEMQRRIDRGGESDDEGSRGRADDADTAGSIPDSELDENREDQDTVNRSRRDRRQPATEADERSESRPGGETRQARPSLSSEAELLAAQAEVSILEEEVARLKAERQELIDQMARRQADFDNYRKRQERERAETYGRVAADVAAELLPVVDNLRRALEAEASVESGESEEFRNFLRGVELIARQLNGVLEQLGVQEVEAVGRPFDPHFHEAVATEQTDEHEPDTVTQEIQRGYRMGERLLRPAMVKVATR
ncbi:MAG TPA: nucleotide exchange factor GrpE [Pyrinomonadaceae bacterium]|nr:nucleotide exchange factor GrpE [Pyrinomonadaceae bacterium]